MAGLLDEGATVPFIARYRKEMTGSLDEVQITAIRDRLMSEVKTNISISVEDSDQSGVFLVSARGAMQIAVLAGAVDGESS